MIERLCWYWRLSGQRLRAAFKQRGFLPCGGCGGPHRFDTSVPSVVWNAVIRKKGLSEYLCLGCVVREFVREGRSFTATLWGDGLGGIPIEIRINSQPARDADEVGEENIALRHKLCAIAGGEQIVEIDEDGVVRGPEELLAAFPVKEPTNA